MDVLTGSDSDNSKKDPCLPFLIKNDIDMKVGTVLAAKFQGAYHRVALKRVLPQNRKVKLEFIDYGTKDIE